MKKIVLAIALIFALSTTMYSCREKTTGEKIEDAAESVGDDIKDGAEEVKEEVEEAVD